MPNRDILTNFLVILMLTMWFILGYAAGVTITTKQKIATTTDAIKAIKTSQTQELQTKIAKLQSQLLNTHVVYATITAYSPEVKQTNKHPYITASMEQVREGRVAVSRDLFYKGWVFGRRIYVEGEGVFIINDLMHERKTNQIDIFYFSTTDAKAFGVQHARIVLLD